MQDLRRNGVQRFRAVVSFEVTSERGCPRVKALIVLAHPEPNGFNAAMAGAARRALALAGYEVVLSDLYRMGFEPRTTRANFTSVKDLNYFKPQTEEMYASEVGGFAPDIEAELVKLETCDLMIWQFPLWWFGLPAALKGWVDRVFVMGRIYGGSRVYNNGRKKGSRAMLSLTTGGPRTAYEKDGFNGDLAGILKPIHRGMLQFIGFDVLAPNVVFGPVRLSEQERNAIIANWVQRLRQLDTERPIDVGLY